MRTANCVNLAAADPAATADTWGAAMEIIKNENVINYMKRKFHDQDTRADIENESILIFCNWLVVKSEKPLVGLMVSMMKSCAKEAAVRLGFWSSNNVINVGAGGGDDEYDGPDYYSIASFSDYKRKEQQQKTIDEIYEMESVAWRLFGCEQLIYAMHLIAFSRYEVGEAAENAGLTYSTLSYRLKKIGEEVKRLEKRKAVIRNAKTPVGARVRVEAKAVANADNYNYLELA